MKNRSLSVVVATVITGSVYGALQLFNVCDVCGFWDSRKGFKSNSKRVFYYKPVFVLHGGMMFCRQRETAGEISRLFFENK